MSTRAASAAHLRSPPPRSPPSSNPGRPPPSLQALSLRLRPSRPPPPARAHRRPSLSTPHAKHSHPPPGAFRRRSPPTFVRLPTFVAPAVGEGDPGADPVEHWSLGLGLLSPTVRLPMFMSSGLRLGPPFGGGGGLEPLRRGPRVSRSLGPQRPVGRGACRAGGRVGARSGGRCVGPSRKLHSAQVAAAVRSAAGRRALCRGAVGCLEGKHRRSCTGCFACAHRARRLQPRARMRDAQRLARAESGLHVAPPALACACACSTSASVPHSPFLLVWPRAPRPPPHSRVRTPSQPRGPLGSIGLRRAPGGLLQRQPRSRPHT